MPQDPFADLPIVKKPKKIIGGPDFSDVTGGASTQAGTVDPFGDLPVTRLAKPSRLAFLAPVAQGMTMGGADEALGLVEGLSSIGKPGGFSEGYSRGKQKTLDVANKFASDNPVTSRALEVAGSIPTIAATGGAGMGVIRGGATYGAVSGALGSEGGATNRIKGAATGAAVGAVTAPVIGVLGKGVGNALNRTPLADAAAKLISKLPVKTAAKLGVDKGAAAAIGARGQVNELFAGRQDILDAIQAPQSTAASTQISRIKGIHERAAKLYNAARQDTRAIDDPELNKLLADPQVKRAYEIAAQIREVSGNPLPRVAAPEQVPAALQKMGVSPERYAELQKLNQNRRVPVVTGTDILSPELMGAENNGVELPDPQVLSSLKRYLSHAAEGNMKSRFPVKQEEALALIPKLDRIRTILHDTSPAWKKADAYYAKAKGEEDAFAKGFDAIQLANKASGKKLAKNSPEAMLAEIQTPRYKGEPAKAMAARAAAFRAGVQAAYGEQIKGAPVDAGLQSILKLKSLAPTSKAARVRSLMTESPAAADATEKVLADKRGTLLSKPNSATLPTYKLNVIKKLVKPFTKPDLVNTRKGQAAITDRMLSPALTRAEIAALKSGTKSLDRSGSVIRNAIAAKAAR